MWWLSLDGKLNLPFNEPDALQLGMQAGRLDVQGIAGWETGRPSSLAGLLALDPRVLLLAAAGYYETTGRTARDLECLADWLGRALSLQQATFAPVERRRRRLLRVVQTRRESYLRHLRRQSDGCELKRQLRRLLRDCAHYPGKWRAGRLLKRWCSQELFEQLTQLQLTGLLQAFFWPESGRETGRRRADTRQAAAPETPVDQQLNPSGAAAADVTVSPAAGERLPQPTTPASASGDTSVVPANVPEVNGAAFERWLQAEKLAALRQLAYGASHEINNPLANIAMRAEMLLRSEAEEDRQRKLQVIRQQALRAHEMISDLMLFANPPRPKLDEIELESYLQQLVAELQPEVSLAGGTLQLELKRTGRVVVDPGQLAEIVRALVRNASEAQPSGAQITIRAEVKPTGEASVEVLDNGPGIVAEVARHMFDPFFSSREAGRGLGFGLAKAWRIAESHGGQLDCLERTAGATRFRFQWPRLQCPAKAA